MCEVHLPIHDREAYPGLGGRKGRVSDIGVGVYALAIEQDWVICLRYCISPGERERDWWRKV
jgi:hypothetical protein